ncbi:54S ribosomal protein L39, mitochondrial [Neolecta irregularis DAH-3]|uniref:54S ribosomal protein L39, mitochondrial n=1 Tax=Neolecta irregularis (strain DAH-3) TaxID=1198029 RepID=A0A1U7LGV1_NEOID|nr:54S ribosomal protein L39, mitochondrial [Neolecta irregularis DAH-3]|eukprot:OLL21877.1 54S ribosomal protein L39, mitochondrial [Neolecta irregularis DAH-3]
MVIQPNLRLQPPPHKEMAKKAKTRTIIVKLASTALTGYFKTAIRPRASPAIKAVKFDPVGEFSLAR